MPTNVPSANLLRPEYAGDVTAQLAVARSFDAGGIAEAYRVPFGSGLGYSPSGAAGLGLIQASALALAPNELATLEQAGFVMIKRHSYPSFPYAYASIYAEDLPVFISADMVLEALHRSYDAILLRLEREALSPMLASLLSAMRARLVSSELALADATRQDLDLYLAVAESLLAGVAQAPVAGAALADIQDLFASAQQASGQAARTLFGAPREIDFSQFAPRGHYQGDPSLEPYFRAMTWLARIDFRLIEADGDSTRSLRRRQVEGALGLRALLDEASLGTWAAIDRVLDTFVGEQDSMFVPQLDELLGKLEVSGVAQLASVSDAAIEQAIRVNHYGEPRIAGDVSQARVVGSAALTTFSFALFGQRYGADSEVFSNLVYDRIGSRVQPSPLDAAFAALGNDQAVDLLANELGRYSYAGDLAVTRVRVDANPSQYWQSNLYAAWLGSLRSLSPSAQGGGPLVEGLPAVARTEAWGRRLLNTQLASWAELRHDTRLYAKPAYITGSTCEFPDAYVEPYPEFFFQVARFGELGAQLASSLALPGEAAGLLEEIASYFDKATRIASTLGQMAEQQRSGAPHTPEQLAFVNEAVRVSGGASGPPFQTGWYRDLFFEPEGAIELDPTIADVHTDLGGDTPFIRAASVLHVATGLPRLMLMTVDTCDGPRAYAGAVFSYYERITGGLERLSDEDWRDVLAQAPPAEVPWLRAVLAE